MMILSNEDAIRAGYANLASYQHVMRIKAIREAEQESASRQAELMASRQTQQSSVGTIITPVPQPNFADEE
jgi:hypothetical protein